MSTVKKNRNKTSEVDVLETKRPSVRPLCTEDVFTMARILSVMDISGFVGEMEKTSHKENNNGAAVWLGIVKTVCDNLDNCRNIMIAFVASLYGISQKQVEELSPAQFIRLVKGFMESEGFKDFFTAVLELLLWV